MQGSPHTYTSGMKSVTRTSQTLLQESLEGLCSMAGNTQTLWIPSPALNPCLTWAVVLTLASAPLSVNWS